MEKTKVPVAYLQRSLTFSAAHRLHSPVLSDEANEELFGKCNRPNGHGHNYKVKVTLSGPIDPATGMIINIVYLNRYIEETISSVLDHKHLDKDIPFFNDCVSSMENLSVFIWNSLKEKVGKLLYEIKVQETGRNAAWYRGETSS